MDSLIKSVNLGNASMKGFGIMLMELGLKITIHILSYSTEKHLSVNKLKVVAKTTMTGQDQY